MAIDMDILKDVKKIGDKLDIDKDDVNEFVNDLKDGLDLKDLEKAAKKIDADDFKEAVDDIGDLLKKLKK